MYFLLGIFIICAIFVDLFIAGGIIYCAIVNRSLWNYIFLSGCLALWFGIKPRPFSALRPSAIHKFRQEWKLMTRSN